MATDWRQISEDFQQKFQGTYIRFSLKEGQPYQIAFVKRVNLGNPPYLILTNESLGEWVVNYDTELDIDFQYPKTGIFFLEKRKTACLFTRQFYRQWKRGLCDQTVRISCPYDSILRAGSSIKIEEDVLVSAFLDRETLSPKKAIDILKTKNALSVPLSSYFSIGLHTSAKDSNYLFWFLLTPVGEYDSGQNKLYIYEPKIKQEVLSYVQRAGNQDCHIVW